jgi:hypothetical protein
MFAGCDDHATNAEHQQQQHTRLVRSLCHAGNVQGLGS